MPRLVLPLAILVAVLTGCAADDSHKPDAWAMSLCTRDLQQENGTKGWWTTGPLGYRLIESRAVTMAEAKALAPGGRLPTDAGTAIPFAASCKVRFAHPELASIRKGAQPALLAFKGGSSLWVDDQYWAKQTAANAAPVILRLWSISCDSMGTVPHFHVSSSLNRASIEIHGLDPARMSAAPGIAGSRAPEADGCFLSDDEFGADYFIRMNNTGGPVDLWAVEGIDPFTLVESPNGYHFYPGCIPPNKVSLVRSDIPPVPQQRERAFKGADLHFHLSVSFDRDSDGWSYDVRSLSAGNYEATGTHLSGASVRAVGDDIDSVLAQCRGEAASHVM